MDSADSHAEWLLQRDEPPPRVSFLAPLRLNLYAPLSIGHAGSSRHLLPPQAAQGPGWQRRRRCRQGPSGYDELRFAAAARAHQAFPAQRSAENAGARLKRRYALHAACFYISARSYSPVNTEQVNCLVRDAIELAGGIFLKNTTRARSRDTSGVMNTARKLGPHAQTDQRIRPGVGL
jgi:hypothetical protein